jgi:tetratricopeptide (TPR) repeat protein
VLLGLAGFAGFVLPQLQSEQRAEALVREGLLYSRRGIPSESEKAVALFERALLEKPGYPPARAALAETTARFSNGPARAAIAMAREALESDPDCDECMATLGYILMTREWAWEESGALLQKAIERNPRDLHRQLWYAQWLSVQGRLAEAQQHAEQAIQLDSTRPHGRALLAGIHYFAGRHPQAIQEAQTAIAMNRKHYQAYLWLERSYMMAGRDLDVIGARGAGTAAWFDWDLPMEREYCLRFQSLLGDAGRNAVANAFIDDVSQGVPLEVNRYNRALWNMWIGEKDRALSELEAGMRSRPFQMVYLAVETAFEPLHHEPRFQELVRQIGLSAALARAREERITRASTQTPAEYSASQREDNLP